MVFNAVEEGITRTKTPSISKEIVRAINYGATYQKKQSILYAFLFSNYD